MRILDLDVYIFGFGVGFGRLFDCDLRICGLEMFVMGVWEFVFFFVSVGLSIVLVLVFIVWGCWLIVLDVVVVF